MRFFLSSERKKLVGWVEFFTRPNIDSTLVMLGLGIAREDGRKRPDAARPNLPFADEVIE
jgi:hypothetical protein